jgi:alpha 1,3-glucosidase
MISHSTKQTNGILWLNAAETWIDITDGHTATDSHWISESGNLDVFLMLGPTPTRVMQQYALLTGTTPLPPIFSLGYHQCKVC